MATGQQHADLPFESSYREGESRTCITLNGVGDEYLENISFSDVHVTYEGGGTAEESRREVPQIAGEYFEIGTPPAYGLYARNVRGLTLSNVRFDVTSPDVRPAVVLDHLDDVGITALVVRGNADVEAVVRVNDARDVLIAGPRVLGRSGAFLSVQGEKSANLTVDGGDLSQAAAPVAVGADPSVVRVRP